MAIHIPGKFELLISPLLSLKKYLKTVPLSPTEQERLDQMTNEQRKNQWLSVRFLIYKYKKISQPIQYSPEGQPILSCCNISISHSRDIVAVALAEKPIGLDVEQYTRNFSKAAQRFKNINDRNILSEQHLALLWTAKEAIYKLWAKGELSFRRSIIVNLPAKIGNYGRFYGKIILQNRHLSVILTYYKMRQNFITIAQYES